MEEIHESKILNTIVIYINNKIKKHFEFENDI